ncbi:MAG: sigma 54-interacting transcriptional regulator [Thermoanaerobaculia bacterium]
MLEGESGTAKESRGADDPRPEPSSPGPVPRRQLQRLRRRPASRAAELFGHEKGSFTGATRRHQASSARPNAAASDEITVEMPMELHEAAPRAGTVQTFAVGGDKDIETDARIVAATNRDPEEAVAQGRLRQDSFPTA